MSYTKETQLRHNRIKPKPKHKNSGKARGEKDPEYLQWLHNNKRPPCIVCGSHQIELHHIRTKGQVGRIDSQVIAMCPNHHRINAYSAHGSDAKEFYEDYPKESLLEIAKELHAEYKGR